MVRDASCTARPGRKVHLGLLRAAAFVSFIEQPLYRNLIARIGLPTVMATYESYDFVEFGPANETDPAANQMLAASPAG